MSNKLLKQTSFLTFPWLYALLITQLLHPQLAQARQSNQPMLGAPQATRDADYAIAYVGPSRDNQQIRLINPDGSNDRLLWQTPLNTDRQHGIGELSWRSDASEVAFDSGHDWQRSLYLRDLYAVTADGSASHRVTRPPTPDSAGAYPTGTVTFWLNSYASGDVQLYIEGADKPISFSTKVGYAYQITQTLPDLGSNVRQYIRLYDPDSLTPNWCNYNETAWVDVLAGQTTDVGWITFGVADDYTCPQIIRPAWLHNSNELLYLFAEASITTFQEENNIWRVRGDAPPTMTGERVLDYSQYLLEGRIFLVKPGRTTATADSFLAVVREDATRSNIFRAPLADADQREFFDLGPCSLTCNVTGLAWLPDGSGFVVARYEETLGVDGIAKGSVIYRYTFADQQLTPLYQIANQIIGRLDVAPDGNQIVYEQSKQFDETTENFWLEPLLLCPCQLWLVNSDGTDAHLLVNDGRAPAWSPASLPAAAPPVPPIVTPVPPLDPRQVTSRVFVPIVQR